MNEWMNEWMINQSVSQSVSQSLLEWKWRRVSVGYTVVTRGADHMLSEKSQWTQNGTMLVDLDWPLNAWLRLSASAELLVNGQAPNLRDETRTCSHAKLIPGGRSRQCQLADHVLGRSAGQRTATDAEDALGRHQHDSSKRSYACVLWNWDSVGVQRATPVRPDAWYAETKCVFCYRGNGKWETGNWHYESFLLTL